MFTDAHAIYALEDPRYKTFRYIGVTNDPSERFQQHLRCTDKSNLKKNTWIQELRTQMLVPTMHVLSIVEGREHTLRQEAYWINHYITRGAPLLNAQLPEVPLPHTICTTTCLIYFQFYKHVLQLLERELPEGSYRFFYPIHSTAIAQKNDQIEGVHLSLDLFTREAVTIHFHYLAFCHLSKLVKWFEVRPNVDQVALYNSIFNEDCKELLTINKQFPFIQYLQKNHASK